MYNCSMDTSPCQARLFNYTVGSPLKIKNSKWKQQTWGAGRPPNSIFELRRRLLSNIVSYTMTIMFCRQSTATESVAASGISLES